MKKSPSSPSGRRCFKLSAVEKLKIVKLFLEDGYTQAQPAAQIQVGKNSIGTWVGAIANMAAVRLPSRRFPPYHRPRRMRRPTLSTRKS